MDEKNIVEEQNIIPEEKLVTPSVDTALLARCVRVLFWLIIASLLISFLTGETISETMPVVAAAAQIANILVVAFYGFVLLKMSAEAIRYRGAAICHFISAAFSLALFPISADVENPLVVIAALLAVVIDMIGEYYEYMGHTDVLVDVDRELSGKWFKLWKGYLITFLGIFAGTILTVLIALIGMLVMLACTIGTLVVSILKVVYIYKMANVLKEA